MKELERDLGLPSVLAISIGAMIGSGIFILPALALEIAGPMVIAAYALAGLLVVPAALSKAEMATAMPEAGGTYIYIERGMGPLLGTIAGGGTWFSLSFKGALALVGGVPYLLLIFDLPLKPVALGLAGVLILVNTLGAKQTGRLQLAIVLVMLAALGWFSAGSAGAVQPTNFEGFYDAGVEGLLAATGLVFVSYAGVTKVASIAEEVEDPGRNIPLGILGSLAFTTLLYVGIVFVLVGITDPGSVAGSLTPVAVAAEVTLGQAGVVAVILAAVLALISTANAGILSSSRYPFAMSRDGLVPSSLSGVSERFGTPINAITLTGAVLLVLIAFVPILEIAKLASAFQLLVFALVNVAVIAFREGVQDYEPEFTSPLYPYIQIAGVVTGLALLTQMGAIAIGGAAGISAASLLWYLAYVRPRVDREGAAAGAIRAEVGRRAIDDVEMADSQPPTQTMVALTGSADPARERCLVALAADMVREEDGRVLAALFQEVPDQVPLTAEQTVQSDADRSFERRMADLAEELEVEILAEEVVSHDSKHAMVNVAESQQVDAMIADHAEVGVRARLAGDPIEWAIRHAPCPVLLADGLETARPGNIALRGADGVGSSPVIQIAETIAAANDGSLTIQYSGGQRDSSQREAVDGFRERLESALSVPVKIETAVTDGGPQAAAELLLKSGVQTPLLDRLFPEVSRSADPDLPVLTLYPSRKGLGPIRRALTYAVR